MFSCDNCRAQFSSTDPRAVVVKQGDQIAAVVCPICLQDTKVIKLALRRNDDTAVLKYDQFTAVEMVAKAFGR